MASSREIRLPVRGGPGLSGPILGEWWEGKVRPIPGNAPRNRPVSRGISMLWSICDDSFRATRFPQRIYQARGMRFLRHGGIYLVRWGASKPKPNPGPGPYCLPSAGPSQDQTTRREDHALSHRPQMSSGRLFLDQVGRHQSLSLLHRRLEPNTHPAAPRAKGDTSTLPARGHFYFALTFRPDPLTL